jgi:hypothetical protein
MVKPIKLLKLWWRMFNREDNWAAEMRKLENKVAWKVRLNYLERTEYVKRMSGGYPTGEKP